MNKRNKSLVEMHRECNACLNRNGAKFVGNQPLKDAMLALQTKMGVEQQMVTDREKDIKGYTQDKKVKLNVMANLTDVMRAKIKSVYESHNDVVNYVNCNFTHSAITHGSSLNAIAYCQIVHDLAVNVSSTDKTKFMIGANEVDALQSAISVYSAASVSRRGSAVMKQTSGDVLEDLIRSTSEFIRKTITNLIAAYKLNDPALCAEWDHAKTIMNSSAKHGQIAGEVKDAVTQQPLRMVKVVVTNGTDIYEEITNKDGKFKVPVSPELWDISFELPSYTKYIIDDLPVEGGVRQEVLISLKKPVENSG